jgi:hypothetical protein
VRNSGGGIADKSYQGRDMVTPRKRLPGGELSKGDKENNAVISAGAVALAGGKTRLITGDTCLDSMGELGEDRRELSFWVDIDTWFVVAAPETSHVR